MEISPVDRRRRYGKRRYELRTLNSRHHEILRMALLGFTNVEIASRLRCTPTSVSIARNSAIGRRQTSMLNMRADEDALDTARRLRDMAGSALDVMSDLLTNDEVSYSVKLGAAKDVLDRTGFSAPKQVQVSQTTMNLNKDDLEDLKNVAYERAIQSGLVIDAENAEADEVND